MHPKTPQADSCVLIGLLCKFTIIVTHSEKTSILKKNAESTSVSIEEPVDNWQLVQSCLFGLLRLSIFPHNKGTRKWPGDDAQGHCVIVCCQQDLSAVRRISKEFPNA